MNLRLRNLDASKLRLFAVVAAVVVAHVFLLTDLSNSLPMPTRMNDKVTLSIDLLRPTVAPIESEIPSKPLQTPVAVPDTVVGSGVAQKPDKPGAVNFQRSQRDDMVSLDFQLADIQGPAVAIGNLNLTVRVAAGAYESRAVWSAGATRGESLSTGDADSFFKPRSFVQQGDNPFEAEFRDAAQDPLSVVWNLRNLVVQVLTQPSPDYGRVWDVPVQIDRSLRQMHWKIEPMDDLILPAGRFRAAKVAGTADQDENIKMNIWYAVDFEYVPVRIEKREESGRTLDAKISTLLERPVTAR